MNMKKLILFFLAVLSVTVAFATFERTEVIFDNGVRKGMATCLIELDDTTFSRIKKLIPESWVRSDLTRNYIGYWKIQNDSLFLDSLYAYTEVSGELEFRKVKLDDIYASRRTSSGYFADWVTDTLRVVSGGLVTYVHSAFDSSRKNEEFVAVKQGKINGRTIYHNRIISKEARDYKHLRKTLESLGIGEAAKRIVVTIAYKSFDSKGEPTNVEAKVVRGSRDESLDKMVEQAFSKPEVAKQVVPIYFINGRYTCGGNLYFFNLRVIFPDKE